VDAAAWASNGQGQQHDALIGVALSVRNSHQDKSASAMTDYQAELLTAIMSSTSRRNVLGAIAFCKERLQLPAATTTATNREEPKTVIRKNHDYQKP
jgi:hypothetical protein